MSVFKLGPQDLLYYEHTPPDAEGGVTFVFFNALTSDTGGWQAVIGPRLRAAGHGTLAFNFRGQTDSPFSSDIALDADLMAADAAELLGAVRPQRPVLVGLSIGGLFAARAFLAGASAEALVLINTLRKDGPRLQWIGDALVRAAEVGGLELFRDLFLPLLVNEEWQQANRANFIAPEANYTPLPSDHGHYKLLAEAGRSADWDLPYEQLDLPVLVITGLQDHVFLETEVVAELAARLPKGRRVDMPDAGHLIPAERPEALADQLIQFAQEV
ncbi:MAG: alpha/beta hydrolase [Desulfosarcinaceae bacterium]|nr:alpha/beta hydrolase [Desulfosarcinaceae bacterium]